MTDMKQVCRRNFLAALAASGCARAFGAAKPMRVTRVDVLLLEKPLRERLWMALRPIGGMQPLAQRVVVTVHTDSGLTGIGAARESSIATFRKGFAQIIAGENPLETSRLWDKMFRVTTTRTAALKGWDRDGVIAAMAGIDSALWDLLGKHAGQPLYQLWGGAKRPVECYATCAYYREGETEKSVAEEISGVLEQGYSAIKLKVGGASIEDDVKRVALARKIAGPKVRIMLDANNGWSLHEAIEASNKMARFDLTWLEEPLHWYDDVQGLRELQRHCPIPLASGEQEQTRYSCRRLLQTGAIRYLQYDCHKYCGPTEALRVAALAASHDVLIAPHHEPQLNGHLMCATPNGYILESFSGPDRDPFWYEIYAQRPQIKNGWMEMLDLPGIGVEYDPAALKKYGKPLV